MLVVEMGRGARRACEPALTASPPPSPSPSPPLIPPPSLPPSHLPADRIYELPTQEEQDEAAAKATKIWNRLLKVGLGVA